MRKHNLVPDEMFGHYWEITPDYLRSVGIRALLIDIDNTLAPYEQDEPDERIRAWFDELQRNGISAALVSNNHKERVELFNKDLELPAYPDCGKPKTATLLLAIEKMGASLENSASIGDQLLTDALAAHRLGIPAYIVPPIKDKKNLFFRFKRWLEKPYVRRYKKLEKEGLIK